MEMEISSTYQTKTLHDYCTTSKVSKHKKALPSDNFDANLSKQNRLKQTHFQATIVTKYNVSNEVNQRMPIKRHQFFKTTVNHYFPKFLFYLFKFFITSICNVTNIMIILDKK